LVLELTVVNRTISISVVGVKLRDERVSVECKDGSCGGKVKERKKGRKRERRKEILA